MRQGRWSRIVGIFLGMTMLVALIIVVPVTEKKLLAGSGAEEKDLNAKEQIVLAKPGDEHGGPGEGPGGGPGGPGGKPGEGPGGGPGGPGEKPDDGPGKNDPKKKEETEATTATNTPTPTPTSTPVPTNTPIPTPSATPAPTATSVPKETAAPSATSPETTIAPETSDISGTELLESTLPGNPEETIPGSQDTSSSGETTAAVVGVVEPSDTTDPSGDVSDGQITPSVTAAEPAAKTSGRSYLWIFILLLLLLIIYLRYRHLSKKGMSFPEIMKNFIPVGALISKFKPSKKEDNYKLDGPQPEVMNGLTSTNADRYSVAREGAKACTVSIPLRNMHTPAEVIDLADVELTGRLIAEYIKEA